MRILREALIREALIMLIFTVAILLVSTPAAFATEGDILLFDDFNDGNLDGWTIEFGNWYTNNGNLVGSQSGRAFGGRVDTGNTEWDNYRLELDVNGFQGIDQGIGFRYSQNGYYEVNLRYGTGIYDTPQVKLWKNRGNEDWVLLTNTHSFPLINNQWYHVKIES